MIVITNSNNKSFVTLLVAAHNPSCMLMFVDTRLRQNNSTLTADIFHFIVNKTDSLD